MSIDNAEIVRLIADEATRGDGIARMVDAYTEPLYWAHPTDGGRTRGQRGHLAGDVGADIPPARIVPRRRGRIEGVDLQHSDQPLSDPPAQKVAVEFRRDGRHRRETGSIGGGCGVGIGGEHRGEIPEGDTLAAVETETGFQPSVLRRTGIQGDKRDNGNERIDAQNQLPLRAAAH